jgi:hypothetical protein
MLKRTLPFSIITMLALSVSAYAQGGGGGSGGGGSGGGAAGASGTGGTAQSATTATTATTATGTPSATGGTADTPLGTGNPAANPKSSEQKAKIEAEKRNEATTGSNTLPTSPDSGAVSGPGVGVGHAANGKPIGSPGSGLGSPGNTVGPTSSGR